jgi:hypothetical protein
LGPTMLVSLACGVATPCDTHRAAVDPPTGNSALASFRTCITVPGLRA